MQAPGDAFERALRPAMGLQKAFMTKWFIGKGMWLLAFSVSAAYYAQNNAGDWTTKGGWKAKSSKPSTMADNPHYPKKDPKWERNTPEKYFDQGFSKRVDGIKSSTPTTH